MDKRVIRTKRTIKETLVKLLQKTQFEHITVKTICDEACTSRITFYNYYSDKYALVEEMFEDYMNEALADYYALQKENNKEKDDIKGYNNMLTAIINLVTNNRDFFEHTGTASNPYLYSGFYNYIYNDLYQSPPRQRKTQVSHQPNRYSYVQRIVGHNSREFFGKYRFC